MAAPGRIGTLSPASTTDSVDWSDSPITRYANLTDSPYSPTLPPNSRGITPPTSVHSSTNTTDGGMGGMGRPSVPSPPSSVGRSSDGTGLYASRMADSNNPNSRKMLLLEETLAEHYKVLKAYLGKQARSVYLQYELTLHQAPTCAMKRARGPRGQRTSSRASPPSSFRSSGNEVARRVRCRADLSSTDVYDESLRREDDTKRGGPGAPGNETPKFLLPKNSFHPKRNQARQKLSTLPLERFRQLATDVYNELERRSPRFTAADIPRAGSPATSIASRTSRGPPSRVGTPNSMNGGMNNGGMRPGPGPGPGPGPNGRPPPGPAGYRNGAPSGPPPGGLAPGQQMNEYGRPLPKTFQQNTIVPNKGTMVEDDDDDSAANDDDEDAFNLEGAAPRQSRQTTKSVNIAVGALARLWGFWLTNFAARETRGRSASRSIGTTGQGWLAGGDSPRERCRNTEARGLEPDARFCE